MRNFVRLAALAIAAALFSPASSVTAGQNWDMPMAYAPGNFHSQTAMLFAKAVERATDGELKIVVHAGGSLFPGGEIKRAVQTGQAQIGERLMSALSNEHPMFGIDAVPFLATSFDEAWRLYQSSKPAIEELLAKQNLVFLYATPWPPQGLYADRPIAAVEDMHGMKFRAYNPATSRLAQLMGATPTQIETAELSQALATGVANSLITSGATGVDRKVWEHLSHFYNLQAWLPKNMVFIHKGAWESLPPDLRAIVDMGCEAINMDSTAEYMHGNAVALKQLVDDPEVELRAFPKDVIDYLKSIANDVVEHLVKSDPAAARIYPSLKAFRELSTLNQRVSEQAFLETRD